MKFGSTLIPITSSRWLRTQGSDCWSGSARSTGKKPSCSQVDKRPSGPVPGMDYLGEDLRPYRRAARRRRFGLRVKTPAGVTSRLVIPEVAVILLDCPRITAVASLGKTARVPLDSHLHATGDGLPTRRSSR